MKQMKKILFSLSNPPTKQFVLTRHNVGRLFIEEYLIKKLNPIKTHSSKFTQYQFKQYPNFIACTSQTYMNLSGKAIESFIAKNRNVLKSTQSQSKSLKDLIKQNFLIIHDDLQHKFGNVRIKQKGSSQGHNGIKSIISFVRGQDFRRIHIGIDRPQSNDPQIVAAYVLNNFKNDEIKHLKQVVFPKVYSLLLKQKFI